MDSRTAVRTVSRWSTVTGDSDESLCRWLVERGRAWTAAPQPAAELGGGILLRPLDALRGLALATRPALDDDLLQEYAHWALLRYLGAFDLDRHRLVVSDAGERVAGNQRRVMSEDLGVALGLELAARWISAEMPPGEPLRIADADALGWTGPRPDYVVMAGDPGDLASVRIGLVECKGTRTPQRVGQRLASACAQLDPHVYRWQVPGLAVSGLFTRDRITYTAAQLEPLSRRPADADLVRVVRDVSWMRLAAFAGNDVAAARWSSDQGATSDVLGRLGGRARQRVSVAGIEAVGMVNVVPVPRGEVEVLMGVDRQVDDALERGPASAIDTLQRVAARRAREVESLPAGTVLGPDGSVLSVRVRPA